MDENKNQNKDQGFGYDSENDSEDNTDRCSNAVPVWMSEDSNDDENESENEDSSEDVSLVNDQKVDIDEYEEDKKSPFQEEDDEEDNYEEEDGDEEDTDDNVVIAKLKVILIKKLLANIKDNGDKLNYLLSGLVDSEDEARINISEVSEGLIEEDDEDANKIIEGVFDGENMIGPDGKQYSVPSNYASKSKLVEGDILKLTITQKGTFVYKQIKPIERERVIGVLERAADGGFLVAFGVKRWRILTASVTYFKGELGDEVIILVPRASDSKWAAVENIIRNR